MRLRQRNRQSYELPATATTMRTTTTMMRRRTTTTRTLACCSGLALCANGGALAFAPSSSSAGIRRRYRPQSSGSAHGSPTTTTLGMTELLLSDTGGIDALVALSSSASSTAAASSSARGLLSSFLGDSTFVGLPAFLSGSQSPPTSQIQSLYLDALPTDLLSTATRTLTSTATSSLLSLPDLSLTLATTDPRVESEVLADFSHVALDLITFAGPTRAFLRLSVVCGRLLAIAADWVPDHYLHPEELVFQLFMLSVSVGLLIQTALPVLPALMHQSTNRYGEKRAYGALFKRHGGLSWVQTKMVLAGGGAEWFEIGPGEVVVMDTNIVTIGTGIGGEGEEEDGGHLYWLQKGEAELLVCSGETCVSKEKAIASTSSSSSSAADGGGSIDEVAILGELEFARRMQDQSKAKQVAAKAKSKSKTSKAAKKADTSKTTKADTAAVTEMASSTGAKTPTTTTPLDTSNTATTTIPSPATTTTKIRAGPSGATLLRLDAARLLRLVDDDDALADGLRSIVFAGMQDKLRRVMEDSTTTDTTTAKVENKSTNEGMRPALYSAYEPYEPDF